MKKTIVNWFTTMPSPLCEQALDNVSSMSRFDLVESLAEAIEKGFIWSNSPQGQPYWSDVYQRAKKGEFLLPYVEQAQPVPFTEEEAGNIKVLLQLVQTLLPESKATEEIHRKAFCELEESMKKVHEFICDKQIKYAFLIHDDYNKIYYKLFSIVDEFIFLKENTEGVYVDYVYYIDFDELYETLVEFIEIYRSLQYKL